MNCLVALRNDQAGAVISAELVLVLTVTVLAMVVGLSEVAVAVNTELNDVSNAIGALNQSYFFSGFVANSNGKLKSSVAGSSYADAVDDCDLNASCDMVCSTASMENGAY